MRELKLASTLASLDHAVYNEAIRLIEVRGVRKRVTALTEQTAEAEKYYAAEISEFLAQPDYRLTPTDILSYARKPTAWAIAQIILGARRGEWTGG
jgi:hypothetical protein